MSAANRRNNHDLSEPTTRTGEELAREQSFGSRERFHYG